MYVILKYVLNPVIILMYVITFELTMHVVWPSETKDKREDSCILIQSSYQVFSSYIIDFLIYYRVGIACRKMIIHAWRVI